jgi:hypothetical protein
VKNKFFFFNIKFNYLISFAFSVFFCFIILYPTNFIFTETFDLFKIDNPFFHYLRLEIKGLAFPFSLILIFYLIYVFCDKKLFLQTGSLYFYFFSIYLLFYLIFSIIYSSSIDIRMLKNNVSICLLIFSIITFSSIRLNNNFKIYKCYNYILSIICLSNLFNLVLFIKSSKGLYYFSQEGYLASYLNSYITHFFDYFPYVVFLSTAADFIFYPKNKNLVLLFISIKVFWYLTTNYYSTIFIYEVTNKGLLISILFFLILFPALNYIKNLISKKNILLVIILINLFYLIIILGFYNYLESSIRDRGEAFFYLFQNMNILDLIFPMLIKYNFLHNLHNDFWDLYFTYGLLFLFFYNLFSNILDKIFKINQYSFLIIFTTFVIGSLVQNNLLNIYIIFNFAFIFNLISSSDNSKN